MGTPTIIVGSREIRLIYFMDYCPPERPLQLHRITRSGGDCWINGLLEAISFHQFNNPSIHSSSVNSSPVHPLSRRPA
ncbi:MAG: hypothetical protein ACRDGA_01280, partial [Bacteroidota bacterium]